MRKKGIKLADRYKGIVFGFIVGVFLLGVLLLSDTLLYESISQRIFLFLTSVAYFCTFQIEKLTPMPYSNVLGTVSFAVVLVVYYSFIGNLIYALRKTASNKKRQWAIIIITLLLHVMIYMYVQDWFNSLAIGIAQAVQGFFGL
ncbi:MAG: hypothetical protein HY587_06345 [Candidatus Omnitrophica bacterium]|nr:hypothetical protein [Candidatus Omnitrophota bacterium]